MFCDYGKHREQEILESAWETLEDHISMDGCACSAREEYQSVAPIRYRLVLGETDALERGFELAVSDRGPVLQRYSEFVSSSRFSVYEERMLCVKLQNTRAPL